MNSINDTHNIRLSPQADWQKSRSTLSWPEKIRQAEMLRNAALILRGTRPTNKAQA